MSPSTAVLRLHHPLRQPRNHYSTADGRSLLPRPCSCCIGKDGSAVPVPFRASVVLKHNNFGSSGCASHIGWVGTRARVADKNGGELSVEMESKGRSGPEIVKSNAQSRQRSGGGSAVVGNPDLLTIPGVGPRNLRKLVKKGFEGVAQLKQLYKDKFFGESRQKMVEYLQSSVGIIHKNHAESITTYIKKCG